MPRDRSILTRPAPPPDRTLRYGPDPDHVADAWLPAAPTDRPLVMVVHGGFWRPTYDRVHTRTMAATLRDGGWPVLAVEYRRVPGRPDLLTGDVRTALETLPAGMSEALGHEPDGIVLIGHSAGGHLVLWAACQCPPANLLGTLALAPVADLTRAYTARLGGGAVADFLGDAPDAHPDLDPSKLGDPLRPVTIVHGDDDSGVPLYLSESYVAAHPMTRLVVIPDTGHFELIDPITGQWERVLAELSRLATA